MRSHQQVIDDAKGPSALAHTLGVEPGTVKQWKRNNSIPAPYWQAISEADIATLDELAAAAATRRELAPAESQAART